MAEPIMQEAKGDGVMIQLAVWEGERESILCIHGLTANCRCWDRIAGELAPEFRVLALDLRGRGLSGKPSSRYCIDQHVRDVYHVMEDLRLERVSLLGHSLGAYISLAFSARYPNRVDKLILMDGAGHLPKNQWEKIEFAIKPSLARLGQIFPSYDEYTAPLREVPFLQPWTPFLDVYFRYEIEETRGGVRSRTQPRHILEEIASIREFDASRFYCKILCPVLILRAPRGILGQDDQVLTGEAVNRMLLELRHATHVEVKGTNHFSILFQPHHGRDRAIRYFLRR